MNDVGDAYDSRVGPVTEILGTRHPRLPPHTPGLDAGQGVLAHTSIT